jgi:hypothetical protein
MSRKELSETVDTAAFKHANAAETPAVVRGAVHSLEPTEGTLLTEELQLAFRNRGMPLEAMREDLTPTGLHYLLAHWDIPPGELAADRRRVFAARSS